MGARAESKEIKAEMKSKGGEQFGIRSSQFAMKRHDQREHAEKHSQGNVHSPSSRFVILTGAKRSGRILPDAVQRNMNCYRCTGLTDSSTAVGLKKKKE